MKRICALVACLLVPLAPACDRPVPVAPEGSTLTITANPSKIGITGTSAITILARKLDGTPVNGGTEITLSTNLGEIEALVSTNSSGVALATLHGDGRVGMATVQAFSGAAGEAMIDVQIGALAEFIELTATPAAVPRDGGEVALRAQAFDAGTPLQGAFISFSSEIGSLASNGASIQTDANGVAIDTLTVTREQMANLADSFFLVTARTSGVGAQVEETLEIEIGGNPAQLIFQATPTTIPQTGGAVNLLVTVVDGNFDPLPGVSVFFLTDIGTLSATGAVPTTEIGEARNTLTATESELTAFGGTSFTIRVQAGGVGGVVIEASVTIRIQTGVPRASFIVSGVEDVCERFRFTSTTTGSAPLNCSWSFGDGSSASQDCTQPVEHSYGGTGTFVVTLTASNALGMDSATGQANPPHSEGDSCP
jgi:PKD domain